VPIKITTLNVNGLRSAERRGFRRWLRRAQPDVLCLQEIRCDEESAPKTLWRPRGWKVGWHPASKKGYAGTAVWSRSAETHFTIGNGHPRGDLEGRAVCAHLPELDVWSLYMPSGSSGPERQAWKFEFMAHAWDWLERLRIANRPTLICGDINIAHRAIDLKNWRSNQKNSGFLPEERAWMDRLLASGWRDLFRERYPDKVAYSWWSNRGRAREKDVGWRIDYVLATPGVSVVEYAIERDAGLSDHAPVSAWIEIDAGAAARPRPAFAVAELSTTEPR
jgi:exodeoxyribonuclease-3